MIYFEIIFIIACVLYAILIANIIIQLLKKDK
jgi:hypothetical protein